MVQIKAAATAIVMVSKDMMAGLIKSVVIDFATAMPNKKGATNSAIPQRFKAKRGGKAWEEITPATMLEESRKPFMKAKINARTINTQSKINHPIVYLGVQIIPHFDKFRAYPDI
jgi:hypothetical protein